MSAPALIMVAHGSVEPSVRHVSQRLQDRVRQLRPDMSVHYASLGDCTPTPDSVIRRLAKSGVQEVVFVPLHLTNAISPGEAVDELVAKSRTSFPELNFVSSRPLGPEISLLNVLDSRLRLALSGARVLELDGLVLSAPTSGDVRGAALLARRARQWSAHHRLPCLTAAADGSGPSVAQAITSLRGQGRRHIAVGSLFMAADELFCAQAALALRSGAVAVSDPVGVNEEIIDLVLARYAFAAMELLDFADAEHASAPVRLAIVAG